MYRTSALALLALVIPLLILGGCGGGNDPAATAEVDTAGTHTVLLPATMDTVLDEPHATQNYGLAKNLHAGYYIGPDTSLVTRRILVRFDLSSIPAGATINKASVQLFETFAGGWPVPLRAYRVTKNWTELGATWANMNAYYSTAAGSAPCYDLEGTWASFNVLALARSWQSAPGRNFGVSINGLSGDYQHYIFDSREATTISHRPRLKVVYTD